MRAPVVFLLLAVALVAATGAASAAEEQATPTLTDEETTTNESNTTSVSPGQQLAGAVGAQGASLGGELWNRTLSERLANATTDAERAEVVVDEAETVEEYLDGLELARENLTEAWDDGDVSEGQYRASLSKFVIRARTVELRANQTARAAERLPARVRETHGINATRIRTLGERAHDLYQFEGEIAREVANETLTDQSALVSVGRNSTRGNRTLVR